MRKNASTLLLVVIIAAAIIYFYYHFMGNSSSAALTSTPAASGAEVLSDLQQLQAVKLNTSVFSDPAFTALTDFYVPIPPQPVGNPDPFTPLSPVQ